MKSTNLIASFYQSNIFQALDRALSTHNGFVVAVKTCKTQVLTATTKPCLFKSQNIRVKKVFFSNFLFFSVLKTTEVGLHSELCVFFQSAIVELF